ncbi:hypothetical protein BCD67_13960 [Oscillatoriales cyanobacterium USR001]|nr:hypothetical protein BCD67_13960 [Oscillatoriales cyanobacterium USR001]
MIAARSGFAILFMVDDFGVSDIYANIWDKIGMMDYPIAARNPNFLGRLKNIPIVWYYRLVNSEAFYFIALSELLLLQPGLRYIDKARGGCQG